jgi:hypothetical protein
MNESGELVFLRYAFPATDCCSHGMVDEKERMMFIGMLKDGGNPDRKRLEELFPNAVKHLKGWDEKDVRDYWCREHNNIVNDNPVCKVYGLMATTVGSSKGEEDCRVRASGINGDLISYIHLNHGDYFSIHNRMVAEKLTSHQYKEYFMLRR